MQWKIIKKYKIIKPVYLDFLTPQDQCTKILSEGIVEWNEENCIWYISPSGEKTETINCGWIIQKYVNDNFLLEII